MNKSDFDPDCQACAKALAHPDWPLFQSRCRGCQIRSMAQSPSFHQCKEDGRLHQKYVAAMQRLFGDEWQQVHEQIKAEHQRIQEARA